MPQTRSHHAVVIGAGPAGYVCAIKLAQLGVDTLLVDREYLGGVCLNVGCIPSKALIHAAKHAALAEKAAAMGIGLRVEGVDLVKMQEWKSGVVKKLTGGVGQLVKGNGGQVLMGKARVTAPGTVEVETAEGPVVVQCQVIVVATGSRPIQIPGFEFDEQFVLSSTGALALTKLPKELVVIGGGYIGLELGMTYAKLGSHVTVVEMMDQVLPGFSADVVKLLARSLKKHGIDVLLGTKAKGCERPGADGRGAVIVETPQGTQSLPADNVIVAVGRTPNGKGLGLEQVGVHVTDRGFVPADSRMRTNVPSIYSIGDVSGEPMLAHVGSREGEVAAEVIAGRPAEFDSRAIPAVVFTDPEIATVGIGEEQAKKKGLDVSIGKFPYGALGRALSTNETEGFVKILSDAKTDRIVGAEIIGADASSMIAELALAVEMGATSTDVGMTIHAHPTFPEASMEAALAVHAEAVHVLNKK